MTPTEFDHNNHRQTVARFVLEVASEAGFKLGTDGDWLDVFYPHGLDRDVSRTFSRAFSEYQPEIIALIQAEWEGSR